jgi:hypothetical protein
MKNNIDILIIIFALWAFISGLVESDIHIVVSLIFALLICAHIVMYRRTMIIYLKKLKWKWVFIFMGSAAIISTSIID